MKENYLLNLLDHLFERNSPDSQDRCAPIQAKRYGVIWLILPAVLVLGFTTVSHAADEILLVRSGSASIYRQTEQAIRNYCSRKQDCPATKSISLPLDRKSLRQHLNNAIIAVTIGQKAAEAVHRTSSSTPVIHSLITSRGRALLNRLPVKHKGSRTSLLLDQPISRQLSVVKAALPNKKRLGVIYGPQSQRLRSEVRSAVKKHGFTLVERTSGKGKEIGRKLKSLLKSVDLVLALPDPSLYNKKTLANVLLTSFRHKVPVIGFSAGFVKAGALLATHTSPKQVGRQAAQLVYHRLQGKHHTGTIYPADFQLSINRRVAKSLKVSLPGKKEILRRRRQ